MLFTRIPLLARPLLRPSPIASASPVVPLFSRLFASSSPAALARKPTKTKLKTHKGAAKRWISIANGAFKRSKAGKVHLNGGKDRERLNRLGGTVLASSRQKRLLRRLMPYA
ncbi:large subunit ribosomal protein L35 [Pseudohyphozyma bogoriensis]|nr:large subunit ribosomal protein L35 [Pseudohyphozyma bogoriensis]